MKNKTITLAFRVPRPIALRVRAAAEERAESPSEWLRRLVEEAVAAPRPKRRREGAAHER